MPQIPYTRLTELLGQRPGSAVVFLHGEEEHLREEAVDRVVAAFVDPATRDFNLDELRGAELAAEALAPVLATPPMMADYRVVVVRDAQGLSTRAREVVEAVAAQPPAGLVLVVTATIPERSKAKFYTTLQKRALSVEFGALQAQDLPGWLTARAEEEHGLDLEIAAARALVAAIGGQLGVLTRELAKLAAFVGERQVITVEDVRAVVGYVPRVDRWEWFDLVAERRYADAVAQLPTLLDAGESGVGLVIGVTSHLLRVAIAAEGGREALERRLGQYQRWLAGKVAQQARRWSTAEVDDALTELLRTDRLLKSASLSDRQALEELLLRLAHAAA